VIKPRGKKWEVHVAQNGEIRNTYKMLAKTPERKRLLRRTRLRWEDNIRMALGETEWEHVDGMYLAQDRDHPKCSFPTT
jgi:hypothetical protein